MRIAVITPAHDAAATIGETLRSVLAQEHADWRMVVVDDGSGDATAAVAAAFRDPRIRLLRQAKAGAAVARNRGSAEVLGEAFLFLDADDWLAPHALAALAAALAADRDAVAAVGGARFVRADGSPGTRRALRPIGGDVLPRLLVRNLFANGGHLLLRAAAVRAAGGFRDDLTFGEDWEYFIRIALRGRFAAVAEPAPVLSVRERMGGAYWRCATDPGALTPCLDAIFTNPDLRGRFAPALLRRLCRRAEAENAWVVGRSLLRVGETAAGRRWLWRSLAGAPDCRRVVLWAAAWLGLLPAAPPDVAHGTVPGLPASRSDAGTWGRPGHLRSTDDR